MSLNRAGVLSLYSVLAVSSLLAQGPDGGNDCTKPTAQPLEHVAVPGFPFMALPSADGCSIFVSLSGVDQGHGGIAVLRRSGGTVSVARVVRLAALLVAGMALTHDGKLLIASNGTGVVFLDVGRLVSGNADDPVLGYLETDSEIPPDTTRYLDRQKIGLRRASEHPGSGSIQVNVTNDDQALFVADEWTESITVIGLSKARASHFDRSSIIGKIPVAPLPIALVFSPNQRYLYSTSEIGLRSYGWPVECRPEGNDPTLTTPEEPRGALFVIDVAKAKFAPEASVIAKVQAGCTPVRLALSPSGDRAYVTARNDNSVLAFDAGKLLSDRDHALLGSIAVGPAPVGLVVVEKGRRIIATNSNRFSGEGDDRQTLTVIDATKVGFSDDVVLGHIPAGAFPREITVTADQKTLLVANFRSKTVELVDLSRVRLESRPR